MHRIVLIAVVFTARTACGDGFASFNEQIRPILSNNCFACHGPDEEERQADLRLDVAGNAPLDEVLARITTADPDLIMPPADSHKVLAAAQVEVLKQWITAGAPYEQHWSFVAPREFEAPPMADVRWSRQAIDQFVAEKWLKSGLRGNPRADKRTLIRRVTFDLTGLPPTREEIQEFLEDSSEDAYEHLVERLLATPAYGEHMARYWLDLVRFSDTNGLHHDHLRDMTPYRDWVIRSFNNNLPFDQFIVFQLAGDLLDRPSIDQQIASGFNRLHLIIDRGTALPEESFHRNVVDRVSAVGTAFLGLTLECAVCHDHKYDPIAQRDFYQLYAFFNNFDGEPETGGRGSLDFKRGLQPPYIELPTPQQSQALEQLDHEIGEISAALAEIDDTTTAGNDSAPQKQQEQKGKSKTPEEPSDTLSMELRAKQDARSALITTIPAAMIMKERAEVRPAHILVRGEYDHPGDPVERDTPRFLPPLQPAGATPSRLDLATWLVDPSHPLTARVTVNRFWQQLFGVGLVRTSEDFGAQGEAPSHPKLLDYLTVQFVDSSWNVKELMRSIVLSETYRQSSHASEERYRNDPRNRLLARGSRFRLDAEMVRDQMLAVSGLLNTKMYGRSVKPPQPPGLWKTVTMPSSYPNEFMPDTDSNIYRRSLYTFWKRGLPPPQMTIFDAPTRESCTARRERTNTPLQALVLMNEEQYFAAAMHYTAKLLASCAVSERDKLMVAYEDITSQRPSETELLTMIDAWHDFREQYVVDPGNAEKLCASSNDEDVRAIADPEQRAEFAAWTLLVHSMLNLDAVKTRE